MEAHDIMIQEGVADYLDAGVRSEVYFKLNMTKFTNNTDNSTDPKAAMFSKLFNFILYGNETETTNDDPPFPIDPKMLEDIRVTYRVAGTYNLPEGKFPAAYGSAAIIDCHYLLDNFIASIK